MVLSVTSFLEKNKTKRKSSSICGIFWAPKSCLRERSLSSRFYNMPRCLGVAALLLLSGAAGADGTAHRRIRDSDFCHDGRPSVAQRNFVSKAVDEAIDAIASNMSDPDLACIFRNTLPNTLDTTVTFPGGAQSSDDSLPFVITGDITAMWLRDSMNQVLPYIPFAKDDATLQGMLKGLIARQAQQVNLDAYANAFTSGSPASPPSPHTDDQTTSPGFLGTRVDAMVPGIFERKYELDSLCAFLKLSRTYYEQLGDTSPFVKDDGEWISAVQRVVEVMAYMQTGTAEDTDPEYLFQRQALEPTDTLSHGIGNPARGVGLIKSAFRPSDDATTLPFLVPANAMAVVELQHVADLLNAIVPSLASADARAASSLAEEAEALASTVDKAIKQEALVNHPIAGSEPLFAYEVDGFGNHLFMDDANVPSLLSLPYLGYVDAGEIPILRVARQALPFVVTHELVRSVCFCHFHFCGFDQMMPRIKEHGRQY